MSGILSIGTRALSANQVALQTAGNNIANVNTPGYSRQSVVLQSLAGQSTASGYLGNGVAVQTVLRNHSDFLTRQAALTSSVAASDGARMGQLNQLETIFQGGSAGIGAGVSNMLNSFSDVALVPGDLTARTVALNNVAEMAARFRTAAASLTDLQQGNMSQLSDAVTAVNNLADRIATANEQIVRAQGTGHPPNDLLDQRDQLISTLNSYVQTTSLPAADGSVGIFLSGSHPLVLGSTVTRVSLSSDTFGDPAKIKLAITNGVNKVTLEEATLGGGSMAGLLKFQNTDLVNASNLLGRMALAIGTAANDQHKLGLDLNGKPGGDLFTLSAIPNGFKANTNAGSAILQMTVQPPPNTGSTALAASNYEIGFTSATAGSITRLSDGYSTTFTINSGGTLQFQNPAGGTSGALDGLVMTSPTATTASAGDRFLMTPFSAAALNIKAAITSPSALAMALPSNSGAYPTLDAGNANALMALRDVKMFDGATLTDGFASAISDIGGLVQSATSAAAVSKSLAASIESDRTSVSGVNLDEEASKMLQYQQSYQACAKMLQISQSVFDTLMQAVAR